GVCSEIPLEELARRFNRVILVVMDGASMVEAVEGLPLELRSKLELRVADVTSFAGALMERVRQAVEESEDAADVFGRFDQIFSEMRTGEYPSRLPKSDLVVSSLVLSELPRYPMAYADRLVRVRFRTRLRKWDGHDAARERLRRLLIEDHVRLLAEVCRKDGVVYFSDTVSRGPAYTQFPANIRQAAESEVSGDFPSIGSLCHGDFGVDTETAAFERLLAAYERAGEETFEALLPMDQVKRLWAKHGLKIVGGPSAWWWLEYPCAIVHSPGGFRVRSWVLRLE
ncbi:MAG: hypothetical protein GY953_11480, partial [bacterium]|nr:hypothetical protein [bacterium]